MASVGAETTHIHELSTGELDAELAALREHLADLQLPQIAHRRRATILFEGPDGAGKKQALRQLAAAFDPCHFSVHPVAYDRREAAEGHWLARFWRELPGAGDTAIFFRSWYRRVLDDRILGRTDEAKVLLTEAADVAHSLGDQVQEAWIHSDVLQKRLRDRTATF